MKSKIAIALLIISVPAWIINFAYIFKDQIYKAYSKPLLISIISALVFGVMIGVVGVLKDKYNNKLIENLMIIAVIGILASSLALAIIFAIMHFKVAENHLIIFLVWIISLFIGASIFIGDNI